MVKVLGVTRQLDSVRLGTEGSMLGDLGCRRNSGMDSVKYKLPFVQVRYIQHLVTISHDQPSFMFTRPCS